jgi:integrase
MTIDRHPKSPFYRVRFVDGNGIRVCRTLRTSDKTIAMKMATDLEHAAKQARAGSLTAARGRVILNEILVTAGQEMLDVESFQDFASRWLKTKTNTRAGGTATRYTHTVGQFVKHLGPLALRPLSAIIPAHLEAFRDHLTTAGRAPSSVRVDLKTLSALFGHGCRQGLITSNPAAAVDLSEEVGQERHPFTDSEFAALLASASDDWKTAILLGGLAGLRLGDAAGLTWEAVDLAAGLLTFVPQKTKRKKKDSRVVIPIHPKLAAHLERIAGDTGGPLCPSLSTRGTGGNRGLSREFMAIMTAAGVANDARKADASHSRAVSAKSFHSLRHYFNTALLTHGVDEATRMKLSGHSTPEMSRKYSHTTIELLRTAVSKIQ